MKEFRDNRLEEGYALVLNGDLREALAFFESKLAEYPESTHLLMEIASLHYILGEMNKCVTTYKKVLVLSPNSIFVNYRMGVALYRATYFTQAVEVFTQIVESGKYIPMAYIWLGLSYYHMGKEELSINSYKKLIELCPETTMANYYMGVALKASGRYEEALPYFEKLVNENNPHVSAHYHLGRTYMRTYKYDLAKEEFKKVLELDPYNNNAQEMYDYISDDI
jgi:tetratricopeptide (TPR) repeat protein